MTAAEPLLVETVGALLGDHCTLERIAGAEGGTDARLWSTLIETGLVGVGIDERVGGAGGTRHDLMAISTAAGYHAAPVPLVEHLAAAATLELAALTLPSGALALGIADPAVATVRVPWGSVADTVVLVDDEGVRLRSPDALTTTATGTNHAGEPWLALGTEGFGPPDAAVDAAAVLEIAALVRSAAVAGALDRTTELTIAYTGEREQFGRPIGRFQAVQHHLALMAGETVAAAAAVDEAVEAWHHGLPLDDLVATARIAGGRATALVTRLAHQIHGAIGVTDEHRLHLWTRRLWAWRDERDSEAVWATRLGRRALRGGGSALWPALTEWPADA